MRILITGINGFVGPHLAAHLLEEVPDAEIWGLDLEVKPGHEPRLPDAVHMVEADLVAAPTVVAAVETARPEVVFHLAAASTVATSWSSPAKILETNAIGQINLFEALRCLESMPVTVVSSSAEIYGRVEPGDLPIDEDAPLRPVSPYGVSKAAQDLLAYQYRVSYHLPTIRLRLFNHTGPGRPDHFAVSSFARQVAEIEKGRRPPKMMVGDLDVVRDLTDVRDVVRAYWLAAAHGVPGAAYNVCSGHGVSMREALHLVLENSQEVVEVSVDPDRLRLADIPTLYGDHARLTNDTGWNPLIPLEQTVKDLLDWWRQRV